jgi:cbb3-type cytochrome oxidase subunit 3
MSRFFTEAIDTISTLILIGFAIVIIYNIYERNKKKINQLIKRIRKIKNG